MSKVFFTSDLHFGHKHIVKYCHNSRQKLFYSQYDFDKPLDENMKNEMDQTLIKRWNESVGSDDLVYYLGDFSFYDKEKTRQILSSLNGCKIFIQGNHDKRFKEGKFDDLLEKRVDYLEQEFSIIDDGAKRVLSIVMSHYPIYEWNFMYYGSVHLYGHMHDKDLADVLGGSSLNVCWDRWGRILSLEDVFAMTKDAKKRSH